MSAKPLLVTCLALAFAAALVGCGKKADEDKPISEVKADAEKMDADQLKSMAMKYKEALEAKKAEVDKLAAKLKDIPITQILGEDAKKLKADIDALNKSVSALTERMNIYAAKLKEKGGDASGL